MSYLVQVLLFTMTEILNTLAFELFVKAPFWDVPRNVSVDNLHCMGLIADFRKSCFLNAGYLLFITALYCGSPALEDKAFISELIFWPVYTVHETFPCSSKIALNRLPSMCRTEFLPNQSSGKYYSFDLCCRKKREEL